MNLCFHVLQSLISCHRLTADELCEIAEALEIPCCFSTSLWYSFICIEGLALLCAHFCSAGDIYALSIIYDCFQSSITECVNELVLYLDTKWSHLLECDHDHLHPSQLVLYADPIHQCGSPLMSIFGFINCMVDLHPSCSKSCQDRVCHRAHDHDRQLVDAKIMCS